MRGVAILLILLAGNYSTFSQEIIPVPELLLEINTVRLKKGLKPLEYNDGPQKSCDEWALRISKNLVHNTSDKRKGEVISKIYGSSELIIPSFLASDSHKKILLDKKATQVCFAVYRTHAQTIVKKNAVESIPTAYYTVIRTY